MEQEEAIVRELKAAAFEVLMFFPGCGYEGWIAILLKEYTSEVVDVLGSDPQEVVDELHDWWHNMTYVDEITGVARKYCEWSKLFATQQAVDYYRSLVAEAVKAKEAAEEK